MLILLNFRYLTLHKLISLNCVICINILKLQLPLQILFLHDIYNLNNINPCEQAAYNPPGKASLEQGRAECCSGDRKALGSRGTFAAQGNCRVYRGHPAAGVDGSGQLPGTAIKHTLLISLQCAGHRRSLVLFTHTSSTPGHCTELDITAGGVGRCCCTFFIRNTSKNPL